jgi:hypothetical protein
VTIRAKSGINAVKGKTGHINSTYVYMHCSLCMLNNANKIIESAIFGQKQFGKLQN